MGVGDSLLAPYKLQAPLAAGQWHFVGDGYPLMTCDVKFTVQLVPSGSTQPQEIVSFTNHFTASNDGSLTVERYDGYAHGEAAGERGDLLELQIEITSNAPPNTHDYEPDGDGDTTDHRIPELTLTPDGLD